MDASTIVLEVQDSSWRVAEPGVRGEREFERSDVGSLGQVGGRLGLSRKRKLCQDAAAVFPPTYFVMPSPPRNMYTRTLSSLFPQPPFRPRLSARDPLQQPVR